ncbi:ABC transporter permease [Chloroflexota bacterium]
MFNFLVQADTTYRGLFHWFNWFGYSSSVFIRPAVFIIMYSILGRFSGSPEMIRHYAIGVATYSMAVIVLPAISACYVNDRFGGTLAFFFASPANRFVSFMARTVFHFPNAPLSFMAALFMAWIVADLDFNSVNWVGFIVAALITAASVTAFGALVANFAIVFRDWTITQAIPVGMILVLSGVIIPLTVFSEPIQEFARLLPVTNGLIAIRSTFGGSPLSEASGYILREGISGLIYFMIGFAGFTLFEGVSKRRGTLELETS